MSDIYKAKEDGKDPLCSENTGTTVYVGKTKGTMRVQRGCGRGRGKAEVSLRSRTTQTFHHLLKTCFYLKSNEMSVHV